MTITNLGEVSSVLIAITGLIGAIGALIYGKYYPKIDPEMATSPAENNPTLENGKMIRVYEILRDYVTVRSCTDKHEGMCEKFEMIRDEIKQNRELYLSNFKDLSEDMKECRRLMHQMITAGEKIE